MAFETSPPISALPSPARDAVCELQASMGCSLALPTTAALSVIALATQANVDVQRPDGGAMPVSQSFVFIGPSGCGKTYAQRIFLKGINLFEEEFAHAGSRAREEFELEERAWRKQHSRLLSRQAKLRTTGEQVPVVLLQELERSGASAPQPPRSPKLLASDMTIASIASTAALRWPWFGMFSTEGGSIFDGHLMRDTAYHNMIWDGDPIHRDRVGETVRISDLRVTSCYMTQVETWSNFLQGKGKLIRDNGFLARANVAFPDNHLGLRLNGDQSYQMPSLDRFQDRVMARLRHQITAKLHGSFKRQVLTLTPCAEKLWRTYAHEVEMRRRPSGDLATISSAAAKSAEKALRFSGNFHDFQQAQGSIDADTMVSGIEFARWYLGEWARVLGPQPERPLEVEHADILLAWFKKQFGFRPDVYHYLKTYVLKYGPTALRRQPYLDVALGVLERAQILRMISQPGKTKPTSWIELNGNFFDPQPTYTGLFVRDQAF